MLVEAPAAA